MTYYEQVVGRSVKRFRAFAASSPVLVLAWILTVSLSPSLVSAASAQEAGVTNFDLFNIPKDARSLHWQWFTKDFRDLSLLRMPGISTDYTLGIGDQLEVSIVGLGGPYSFQIRATGDVAMPLVGNVPVAGLTAEEAERAIGNRFLEQQLIKNPEVLVYITSYESKKFWVYGQVDRQGEYTMSQPLTVMDGIFMAGGLDFYGDRWGYLHRNKSGGAAPVSLDKLQTAPDLAGPGEEVIKLDLQPMRDGKVLPVNPLLKAGDTIFIPTRYPTVFYVLGDVGQPGPFVVNSGERLTVSQAIVQAGGPLKTARQADGVVVRYDVNGKWQELPVDYGAVMSGKQPDFEVRSNDVIFIPGSTAKALGQGIVRSLPGVLASIPWFIF